MSMQMVLTGWCWPGTDVVDGINAACAEQWYWQPVQDTDIKDGAPLTAYVTVSMLSVHIHHALFGTTHSKQTNPQQT